MPVAESETQTKWAPVIDHLTADVLRGFIDAEFKGSVVSTAQLFRYEALVRNTVRVTIFAIESLLESGAATLT